MRAYCIANPTAPDCLSADLGLTAVGTRGAAVGVLGGTTSVTVSTEAANLGPDGPVDATVNRSVTTGPGLSATPTTDTFLLGDLAVGELRTFSSAVGLTCLTPGTHTATITDAIAPDRAKVVDPVDANNTVQVTVQLDCAIPVTVNAVPGSTRNPVAVNDGALVLALLTTAAGEYGNPVAFDAAAVEASTVRVGTREALLRDRSGAPEQHGKIHLERSYERDETTVDKDRDGVVHVTPRIIPLTPTTTEVCVLGQARGLAFFGCDAVTVVPQ